MIVWMKAFWFGYAALYLMLALLVYKDNVGLNYPNWVVFGAVVAQTILFSGILLYAFAPRLYSVSPYWRWFVPLVLIELAAGIVRDAVAPKDYSLQTHGAMWILNLIFTLALVAPAYYASIKLARYGAN